MADLTPGPPVLGDVDRRLLQTGVPILVSNATVVVIPVIARGHLSTVDYAVFALLMTVVVAAGILDLGGGTYSSPSATGGRRRRGSTPSPSRSPPEEPPR